MAANNTSAFNCRKVVGNPYRISQHSYGNAIDINTVRNPYVVGSRVYPAFAATYLRRFLRLVPSAWIVIGLALLQLLVIEKVIGGGPRFSGLSLGELPPTSASSSRSAMGNGLSRLIGRSPSSFNSTLPPDCASRS